MRGKNLDTPGPAHSARIEEVSTYFPAASEVHVPCSAGLDRIRGK